VHSIIAHFNPRVQATHLRIVKPEIRIRRPTDEDAASEPVRLYSSRRTHGQFNAGRYFHVECGRGRSAPPVAHETQERG